MKRELYRTLASLLAARENCKASGNGEWLEKRTDAIEALVKAWMPSGSGVDNGTVMDMDASTPNRLVFTFGYHHMNDGGYYDGWTEHTCVVTPSLAYGMDVRITGRDRNGVKEYLGDVFQHALEQKVWQDAAGDWHNEQYERLDDAAMGRLQDEALAQMAAGH